MATQDETARLHALRQLKLLGTPASDSFDRITRMAAKLFGVPMAAISLTDQDRQWCKSRVEFETRELPRIQAPCAAIAESRQALVIPDLLASVAYAESPLALPGSGSMPALRS